MNALTHDIITITNDGPLIERTLVSLQTLLMGYAAGLTLAGIFTTLAVSTRVAHRPSWVMLSPRKASRGEAAFTWKERASPARRLRRKWILRAMILVLKMGR